MTKIKISAATHALLEAHAAEEKSWAGGQPQPDGSYIIEIDDVGLQALNLIDSDHDSAIRICCDLSTSIRLQ